MPLWIKEIDDQINLRCAPEIANEYWQLSTTRRIDFVEVAETLSMEGARSATVNNKPKHLCRWQLNPIAWALIYFISARLLPTTHISTIDVNRCLLVYVNMTKKHVDFGRAIYNNIHNIAKFKTTCGPTYGTLIIALCAKFGVQDIDDEVNRKPLENITRKDFYKFEAPSLVVFSPGVLLLVSPTHSLILVPHLFPPLLALFL